MLRCGYTAHPEYGRMPFTPNERFRLMNRPISERVNGGPFDGVLYKKSCAQFTFSLRNVYTHFNITFAIRT